MNDKLFVSVSEAGKSGIFGLSVGGLRKLLFDRKTNGLLDSGAVVRMGRKLLLDVERFHQYLRNHVEKG